MSSEVFRHATIQPSASAAIEIRGVSKCYNIYERPYHRLLQGLYGRRRQFFHAFWALRGIDLQVRPGEVVGIVGRNGSGKSTLLQVICGTMRPTTGSVTAKGRVAALLELGAGFDPDFSGRDNVYMNGAILGLSKAEIDRRFDEIAAFADIGEFMDRPVKLYSSGMYVRLAFAVAACVDPDVLIIDEALAVGDAKFQSKCFRRFDDLTARGTTVILVTHSLDLVTRYCDRAILLEAGKLLLDAAPREVVNAYLDLVFGAASASSPQCPAPQVRNALPGRCGVAWREGGFADRPGYNSHEYRWGSREAEITDFVLTVDGQHPTAVLTTGEPMQLVILAKFRKAVGMPIYGLTIKTPDGTTVFGGNSRDNYGQPMVRPTRSGDLVEVVFRVDQALGAGDYLLSVGVSEQRDTEVIPLDRRYDAIHVTVENKRSKAYGLAAFDMEVEIHDHTISA
jgi:lipopolysaccharide transport system ATP-binding protein